MFRPEVRPWPKWPGRVIGEPCHGDAGPRPECMGHRGHVPRRREHLASLPSRDFRNRWAALPEPRRKRSLTNSTIVLPPTRTATAGHAPAPELSRGPGDHGRHFCGYLATEFTAVRKADRVHGRTVSRNQAVLHGRRAPPDDITPGRRVDMATKRREIRALFPEKCIPRIGRQAALRGRRPSEHVGRRSRKAGPPRVYRPPRRRH